MNPSLFFASNIDTRTAIGPKKGLINIALHAVAPTEIDPAAAEGAVVFGISGHTVREVGVSRRRFEGFGGYYDETVRVRPEDGAIRFEQRRKFRVGLDVLALDMPIELDPAVLASLPELQVTQGAHARVTDAVPITPLAGQAIWARVLEQALPVFAALADGQRLSEFLDQQALHTTLARRDLGADQKAAMAEAFHGRGGFRAALEARAAMAARSRTPGMSPTETVCGSVSSSRGGWRRTPRRSIRTTRCWSMRPSPMPSRSGRSP